MLGNVQWVAGYVSVIVECTLVEILTIVHVLICVDIFGSPFSLSDAEYSSKMRM